jgi:signal transduction histidine kinase
MLDALAGALTPEEAAHVAIAECMGLAGAKRGSVTLWNDELELLEVVETTGYGQKGPPYLTYGREDLSPVATVFRTGQPWFVHSRDEYAAEYPERGSGTTHSGPIVIVPLLVPGGGVVGTLNVGLPRGVDPEASLPLLVEFARIVAQACDRAQLFHAERLARHQADALVRVSAALSAAPTIHDVAAVIVDEGRRALQAPSSYLTRLNEAGDALQLVASSGFPAEVTEKWADIPLETDVPLTECVRTGKPIWLETHEQAYGRYPAGSEARQASGYLASLVVPMLIHDRPVGAMSFSFAGARHFPRSERELAVALAGLAAHAFERADLYESVARVQRTLESIVQSMPVGVTVAEAPGGRILYDNAAASAIWGGPMPVAPAGAQGGQDSSATFEMTGRRLPEDQYPLARALRGETLRSEQYLVRRHDGSTASMLVNAGPIKDDKSSIIAAVSVMTDITQQAESQALREAYLGLLSHELRTPVTTILAGARLLSSMEAEEPNSERRELVSDIEAEADRLRRLVEDLLVVARAERGIEFEGAEPILLQHLVPRIIELERRRWPNAQLELTVQESLPTVMGHPGYLGQVLANLLSNAVKYSPYPARIEVNVSLDGSEVAVRVCDRGRGISEETAELLFEAFYRAPATANEVPGAGVGLFVVRQLMSSMGGRFWAHSRVDGGSEFGFALPILRE